MAVTTYTATTFMANAKQPVSGDVTIGGKYVFGAVSVADLLFLAKVPHGAKIVSMGEYHSNGQTAAAISFGFDRGIAAGGGGNHSCLISSGAVATMNRLSFGASPTGAPVTISLSDADPVRYAIFLAKAESGTFTISVSLGWTLTYRMDGPEPV